jgi:signal peptidase I
MRTVVWLVSIAAILAIVLILRKRLIVVVVEGSSMLPSYRDGERVLAARRHPRTLRPGQVVILNGPRPMVGRDGVSGRIIKRVAAIQGQPVPDGVEGSFVPAGHIVVLGDNMSGSVDSRQLGFIPARIVLATVVRKMNH